MGRRAARRSGRPRLTKDAFRGMPPVRSLNPPCIRQQERRCRTSRPAGPTVWTGSQTFQNGKETIWPFQASANDGDPNGSNANIGDRLNFPYSGSHFGCCGFNQPTQNLVNFYQVDVNGLPLALSNSATWNASDANFVGGPT